MGRSLSKFISIKTSKRISSIRYNHLFSISHGVSLLLYQILHILLYLLRSTRSLQYTNSWLDGMSRSNFLNLMYDKCRKNKNILIYILNRLYLFLSRDAGENFFWTSLKSLVPNWIESFFQANKTSSKIFFIVIIIFYNFQICLDFLGISAMFSSLKVQMLNY